jgi:putative membrane protein
MHRPLATLAYLRTPLAPRLRPVVALLGLYAAAVAVLEFYFLQRDPDIRSDLHALLGAVLGLFLVFRTNTAYDRWWEGRKLWGQLVNDLRNFSIKVKAFDKVEPAEAEHLGRLLVNFARALKEHLREGVRPKQLSVYRNLALEPRHVPAHVALMVREQVYVWKRDGKIDGFEELQLDPHARALMDICGACERIRRTPLPRSYLLFIRQCIALYLLTLPWGLIHDFRYWTIPAVMIIGYFMVGIELIAEEVDEPFGRAVDDLLLDDICQGIEASVTEILSDARPKSV